MHLRFRFLSLCSWFCLWLCSPLLAQDQFPMTELPLVDLSAFQSTQDNWQVAGAVQAPFDQAKTLISQAGTGILVNQPKDDQQAQLFTQWEHGDLDLELEVMLPTNSNSGLFLQGRYEIQLLDSWGKKRPTFGDMGGIYQRWDDTQPDGQQGFEGTAPLLNAAKAPGIWQHLRISFQAPRFDANQQKISNARIIFIELNGVPIHQNVELTGPTRGAYVGGGKEASKGPLVIQGDHGPVAFRNIRYRSFDGQPVQLTDLQYQVKRQQSSMIEDWSQISPDLRGSDQLISWNVAGADNEYAILFEGELEVAAAGDYLFELNCQGNAELWLDGTSVLSIYSRTARKLHPLPAGKVPFRLAYTKTEVWRQSQLGLSVEGNNFRPVDLHYASSALMSNPTDPIFAYPTGETRLMRSFVDFRMPHMAQAKKITNAINVGDPSGIHYTFDLNQGSLVQVWRGEFLNMTPMWNNRGNGVSRPMGVLVRLTPDVQMMQSQADGTLTSEFGPDQYRYRSYRVDEHNRPTFTYEAFGWSVEDQLTPNSDRTSLQRTLTFAGSGEKKVMFCLAMGQAITKVGKSRYLVDEQYYVHAETAPKLHTLPDGRQALLLPVQAGKPLTYDLLW
ncbi:MAG: family 16 glycoside hydrolase [Bacteroidota bacterium]